MYEPIAGLSEKQILNWNLNTKSEQIWKSSKTENQWIEFRLEIVWVPLLPPPYVIIRTDFIWKWEEKHTYTRQFQLL